MPQLAVGSWQSPSLTLTTWLLKSGSHPRCPGGCPEPGALSVCEAGRGCGLGQETVAAAVGGLRGAEDHPV